MVELRILLMINVNEDGTIKQVTIKSNSVSRVPVLEKIFEHTVSSDSPKEEVDDYYYSSKNLSQYNYALASGLTPQLSYNMGEHAQNHTFIIDFKTWQAQTWGSTTKDEIEFSGPIIAVGSTQDRCFFRIPKNTLETNLIYVYASIPSKCTAFLYFITLV